MQPKEKTSHFLEGILKNLTDSEFSEKLKISNVLLNKNIFDLIFEKKKMVDNNDNKINDRKSNSSISPSVQTRIKFYHANFSRIKKKAGFKNLTQKKFSLKSVFSEKTERRNKS
jgi:hypothetical protein